MKIAVLDLETYYDKECSVRPLGVRGYIEHPQFDAYLMSVATEDGQEWVGHPKDFDWPTLDGYNIWAANASFDETIIDVGSEKGWWRGPKGAVWDCVLDAARALGLQGNLAGALKQALGIEMDKGVRDRMRGKRWEDMDAAFKEEVSEYALKDSVYALKLVQELAPKWSEFERNISRLNRKIVRRGLPIDQQQLRNNIETLSEQLFGMESNIPWAGDKPLLSRKAFDEECIRMGIEPPASLAKDDVDAQEWIRINGHKYKWIEAVTNWRRVNALKKKLESFDAATMADGRYYGGLMYYGGHTGRFSGSGGNLNLQNLPRKDMFGVNLRKMIAPTEGKKLVVVDLSQIEVRTLCWLAGDAETLAEIKASDDIYEAFALRFGLWDKSKGVLAEEDPDIRHKVKCLVLGCGYGAGPNKFAQIFNMPLKEAEESVGLYRRRLKKIPQFWRDINSSLQAAYDLGIPFSHDLPSGRSMNYGRTKLMNDKGRPQHVAIMNRNGRRLPMKLWGGVVAENLSQALARDIFSYMMLKIEDAGFKIILHVHDEVVVECDADMANDALETITKIMSTPPEWITDIPLSADGKICDFYTK